MKWRRHKLIRKLMIISGFALLLALATILVAPLFLKNYVEQLLRNKIIAATQGLYNVDFELSRLSFLPAKIEIENFSLTPDSAALATVQPTNYYSLNAAKISVSGMQLHTFLLRKSVNIRTISVNEAYVNIFHVPEGKKVTSGSKKKLNLVIGKLVFNKSHLSVWNMPDSTKRFACNLDDSRLHKVRIRNNSPLQLDKTIIHLSEMELYAPEQKKLVISGVLIETLHKHARIHTTMVNVSEMADLLGDTRRHFFIEEAFACTVDSLVFSAADYSNWPLLLSGSENIIRMEEVILHRPVFSYHPGKVIKPSDSLGLDPLQNRRPFLIGNLEVRNGSAELWDYKSAYKMLQADGIQIKVSNVHNTPPSYKFPVSGSSISLKTDSVKIIAEPGIFRVDIARTGIDRLTRNISFNDLKAYPMIDPDAFFLHRGYQIDYPKLHIPSGSIQGLDYKVLFHDIIWKCREVAITDPVLELFRDKNHPLNQVKRPPFPNQQLLDLPFKFLTDSILIRNGIIRYDEMAREGKDTGHFVMDQVNLSAGNFTNLPDRLVAQDSLVINFNGKFYGKGLLTASITWYTNDPASLHKVEGTIGPLQAQLLNEITAPSAFLMIRSGVVHGGKFRFMADEYKSAGTLLLEFEKLRIALLEARKGSDKLKVNKLKTFVANVFLVKENPLPGQEPVISRISFRRDQSRWIINYWWKSLLSGIDNIVLARKDQMLEIKREADELKKLQEDRENYQNKNK